MNPLAGLTLESVDGVAVAALTGEVDVSNAHEMSARLSEVTAEKQGGIALDLTAVDYLDSSGLQMILNLASTLAERGQDLRVVVPDGSFVASLMKTSGVLGILPMETSREQAVRQLATRP